MIGDSDVGKSSLILRFKNFFFSHINIFSKNIKYILTFFQKNKIIIFTIIGFLMIIFKNLTYKRLE